MIDHSFARAPDGVVVAPLVVKGIVAGVHGVARARLLAGRADELPGLADELATAALREAIASGYRDQVHGLAGGGQVPLLLAISDNGPQMRSVTTRADGARISFSNSEMVSVDSET